MRNIEFRNFSAHSEVLSTLGQAWEAIPIHWKELIIGLPCIIRVYPPNEIYALHMDDRGECMFKVGTNCLSTVSLQEGFYKIDCGDVYASAVARNDSDRAQEYQMKKNFLTACAAALLFRYAWLEGYIVRSFSISGRRPQGMSRMFVDAFPRFVIDPGLLASRNYDLFCCMFDLGNSIAPGR